MMAWQLNDQSESVEVLQHNNSLVLFDVYLNWKQYKDNIS